MSQLIQSTRPLKNGVVITSRFGFRHWLARSQECVSRTLSDWEDRLRFGPKDRHSKAQGDRPGVHCPLEIGRAHV